MENWCEQKSFALPYHGEGMLSIGALWKNSGMTDQIAIGVLRQERVKRFGRKARGGRCGGYDSAVRPNYYGEFVTVGVGHGSSGQDADEHSGSVTHPADGLWRAYTYVRLARPLPAMCKELEVRVFCGSITGEFITRSITFTPNSKPVVTLSGLTTADGKLVYYDYQCAERSDVKELAAVACWPQELLDTMPAELATPTP